MYASILGEGALRRCEPRVSAVLLLVLWVYFVLTFADSRSVGGPSALSAPDLQADAWIWRCALSLEVECDTVAAADYVTV